jgi:transposase
VLSDEERETLQRWARRPRSAQALALRARIVLACAEGVTNKDVAARFSVTAQMVGKWRGRFVTDRLAGLSDEDRSGRPRTVTDAQVERVVTATLEQVPPDGGTHWSTRLMAAHAGLTQTAVSRIWRAFELKPHKVDYWKLSTDPHFVDKLYDVVGLYLDPPERALVLCVDEKSQVQALDRSAPVLPMMPADPARQTHSYIRHGTTSLFAALDMATGRVYSSLQRRHRAVEFRTFLNQLHREVPDGHEVHLILDNYATHKTPEIKRWLLRHPRFHLHFTPTSSSWLNLVERFFAELSTRLLRRGVHRSVAELESDIRAWIAGWNDSPKPFVWHKTAEQILDSIGAYCQRLISTTARSALKLGPTARRPGGALAAWDRLAMTPPGRRSLRAEFFSTLLGPQARGEEVEHAVGLLPRGGGEQDAREARHHVLGAARRRAGGPRPPPAASIAPAAAPNCSRVCDDVTAPAAITARNASAMPRFVATKSA